jgi:hypothetical protein
VVLVNVVGGGAPDRPGLADAEVGERLQCLLHRPQAEAIAYKPMELPPGQRLARTQEHR